jgi:hypothetical protein
MEARRANQEIEDELGRLRREIYELMSKEPSDAELDRRQARFENVLRLRQRIGPVDIPADELLHLAEIDE